ncbi:MAG: PD-(D/E)XK nuclease family protein [Sedimentibacter sp.]|nr:PD-(D/E)XK nuclease family protein [Sedimentibacter sp.]MDW5299562.1 PD-(D/E)XK nuclease family protein [Sedimentibacter sp.]
MAENHETQWMNKQCLINLISAFRNSYLYKRLMKAEEIYTEMPFSYKETTDGMNYYINGRIDLLLKENGNWTIVDYKTCEFKAAKHDLYYEYIPQLETYANAWNAANEEKMLSWKFSLWKRWLDKIYSLAL